MIESFHVELSKHFGNCLWYLYIMVNRMMSLNKRHRRIDYISESSGISESHGSIQIILIDLHSILASPFPAPAALRAFKIPYTKYD